MSTTVYSQKLSANIHKLQVDLLLDLAIHDIQRLDHSHAIHTYIIIIYNYFHQEESILTVT